MLPLVTVARHVGRKTAFRALLAASRSQNLQFAEAGESEHVIVSQWVFLCIIFGLSSVLDIDMCISAETTHHNTTTPPR